jgi:hypothetical protein
MLVGITGFAGSGKDTAAQALLNQGYERRAFADPLRIGLLGVDPWVPVTRREYIDLLQAKHGHEDARRTFFERGNPGETWWKLSELINEFGWDSAKRIVPEVRRLQQTYGTEGGRDVHGQLCWINNAERSVSPADDYVFTDLRFPNERDWIHDHGGITIRITRPGIGAANGHSSEQVLDGLDFEVINDGLTKLLHERVLARVHEATHRITWQAIRSNRTQDDAWQPPEVPQPVLDVTAGIAESLEQAARTLDAFNEVDEYVPPLGKPLGSAPVPRTHLQDMMLEAAERAGEVPSEYLMRTVDANQAVQAFERARTADEAATLRRRLNEVQGATEGELEAAYDDLLEWFKGQSAARREYLRNLSTTGPSYLEVKPAPRTAETVEEEAKRLAARAADVAHEARLRRYAEDHGVEWPNTPEGEAALLKAGQRHPLETWVGDWDVTP